MRKFFRDVGGFGVVLSPILIGIYMVAHHGDAGGTWALVCIGWWKLLERFNF